METLLKMRAADAGLSTQTPVTGGWLECRAAGNRATLWLRREGGLFLAAAAPGDIATEVGPISGCEPWNEALPAEAVAGWRCTDELALDALCRRVAILGHTLPDQPLKRYKEAVAELDGSDLPTSKTERERVVWQRVGQDIFRDALMKYWGGKCPISGVTEPALLRASHIKPWKDSTDEERLDVHNGLLLAAHLDAAFDAGFISVADNGTVLVSERLGEVERGVLGVACTCQIKWLSSAHQGYLAWHRVHFSFFTQDS